MNALASFTLSSYSFADARDDYFSSKYWAPPTLYARIPGGYVRLTKLDEDCEMGATPYAFEVAVLQYGQPPRYLTRPSPQGDWFNGFGFNDKRDVLSFICDKLGLCNGGTAR